MKTFLFSIIAILSLNHFAFANTKAEMSVKEFFLAIPNEYIKADAASRQDWIETESDEIGYLSFKMPADELPGGADLKEEGVVYGNVQVFQKTSGGAIVGFAINMCAEGKCLGQMLLLDYNAGKWQDVTSDLSPLIDNDEIVKTLKNSPAFENKDDLKDGVEVPLAIEFNGNEKLIHYLAGCNAGCDGGVVAKAFKWNGSIFKEYEYAESPE